MERVLKCIRCGKEYSLLTGRYTCQCGGLLDVHIRNEENLSYLKDVWEKRVGSRKSIDESGVWRFRELVLDLNEDEIVTFPEGKTNLYDISDEIKGVKGVFLKHEGENPTGSFKDRGMTVGVTFAKKLGYRIVACASTGNTSASMTAYAKRGGLIPIVFLPKGKIALGKLSQALSYGAKTIQIEGDFDDAMRIVKEISKKYKIYLLNSLNPIRLEGQKTIIIHTFFQLNWEVPDWIILPGGNLGNTSAFGKALMELKKFKIIDKIPKIAVIQAKEANPFYLSFKNNWDFKPRKAETVATAIRIGNPVNFEKAKRTIDFTKGFVEEVADREILMAKAKIDSMGIGCEPASAASLAGLIKMIEKGIVKSYESAVLILTGNLLKDPDIVTKFHMGEIKGIPEEMINRPITVRNEIKEVESLIERIMEENL